MRLVSYDGGFGELRGEEIVPMGRDLVEYLRTGVASDGGAEPVRGATLLAPVPVPGKIICVGLNYREHVAETGSAYSVRAPLFAKYHDQRDRPRAADNSPARDSGT